METVIHGTLPETIRDRSGVLGTEQNPEPSDQLATARAKIAELKAQKAQADEEVTRALARDNGRDDLNAITRTRHRLARELAQAEEEVEQWESVCDQIAKAEKAQQFDAKLQQARATRKEFAGHFRDACLALGRWYVLGSEVRELVNELADRMPTGHVYRPPHLTNALSELSEDPNPLLALKDAGYAEIQTAASWRRHVAAVPLIKKEK